MAGPPDTDRIAEHRVRQVELVISLVLRVGVTLSVAVIAAGLGLMFAHHGEYATGTGHYSYHRLTSPGTPFPHTLPELRASLARGDGEGLVVAGLLLLIATPVLRVAVSVASFVYERDPAMTLVTLFVLAALLGSFFLGGASA
ncbi:MAG: DUF1634 domain-containing protein [Acidimicrobiales bacterium]